MLQVFDTYVCDIGQWNSIIIHIMHTVPIAFGTEEIEKHGKDPLLSGTQLDFCQIPHHPRSMSRPRQIQ